MEHAIHVGQRASMRKTITEADVVLFGCVTGDQNPVHTDEISARESRFGRRIAHGMLAAGLISAVLGMRLPGPGTVYLKQTLSFRKPIYINDTVTTTVVVAAIREDKPIATLTTTVTNQDGEVCVEGESLVYCDQCKINGFDPHGRLSQAQAAAPAE
ncbi:MAG TPA: MaoC family dehydratase [Chloroflexaceae bacterium]|nr:MaoC family dehydratase [Chloroflexaceae bacterium]